MMARILPSKRVVASTAGGGGKERGKKESLEARGGGEKKEKRKKHPTTDTALANRLSESESAEHRESSQARVKAGEKEGGGEGSWKKKKVGERKRFPTATTQQSISHLHFQMARRGSARVYIKRGGGREKKIKGEKKGRGKKEKGHFH